jgi:AAA domain-containing protein
VVAVKAVAKHTITARTPGGGTRELGSAEDNEQQRAISAANRVERLADHERALRAARRIVDNEGWKAPDPGRSLAEARKSPPAPVLHVVEGLLPEGISMLNAPYKVGKTIFGIDLSACLVSDQDFLNHFKINDIGGDVGYWNLEVDEPQMFEWQNRRIKRGASRVHTAPLRGRRMDLFHEPTVEWTIDWLKDRDIVSWIIDPLGRLLDDENNPSEFNRWFRELERIAYEADVRMVLLMHHSGHAAVGQADSVPRARGASSMGGNTDANLSYRHGGSPGSYAPNSRRYLSAMGRGVDVPELTLDYESGTGRLYVIEDAPGREADKLDGVVQKAVEAVTLAGDWVLNNIELQEAIGGNAAVRRRAITAALDDGAIISRSDGTGKPTLYALPGATSGNGGKQRVSKPKPRT